MSSIVFSSRTNWSRRENSLSGVCRKLRKDERCVDLTASNPTRLDIQQIESPDLRTKVYEPEALGLQVAREAVCHFYERRGINVDPSRVVITASTSEAYNCLFRLLCDPGDQILLPSPSYPLFAYLTQMAALQPEYYQLDYDGSWFLDTSTLSRSARAIVQVSPNNPTGSFLSPEQRVPIQQLGVPVISDEVFADYTRAHHAASWINHPDQLTFSLNGLSKVAGLPQHKLAWIVLSGPKQEVEEARARLEIMLDAYLSVASGIQNALPEILMKSDGWQKALNERIAQNRKYLKDTISNTALTLRPAQGGWYAIIQMPNTQSDEQWALDAALKQNLIVQPGYFYDMTEPSCIVLSLIVEPEKMREGVQRLLLL